MSRKRKEHPGGEALTTAREVVADFATDGLTEAMKTLPAFCASVQTLGWAGAVAGLSLGAAAPVVACGMILGGTVYLKWKQDQRDDGELRAHFGALAAALSEIQNNQNQATTMLAEIYERHRFVWAKIDGNDKQAIADKVTEALGKIGFDGTITVEDLMGQIRELQKDVAGVKDDTVAIRRDQVTKDQLTAMEERQRAENAAMEKRLRAVMEEHKRSSIDQTKQEWPPELIEQAKVLRERGDKEQRAVAEIALRNHEAADRLIQELKKDPIAEAFRLLTLEGDNWYQANEPDKAIGPYKQALALRPDDITARNNAMIGHISARLGDIAAHRRRAIDMGERTLTLLDPTSTEWAATQNNLGNAWIEMPTGDRADNLRRAIEAFEQALTVYTKSTHPAEWAATQNNLGSAWSEMPTGDRADNLRRAIEAYEQALTVYTKPAHPAEWAMTQNNLGNAWSDMPTGDRADNLRRAIEAFEQALTVRTKAAHPTDWAMTQNNLGNAWSDMPTGDRADDLRRAIEAFEHALTVYTKPAHPAEWAATQNNLGIALGNMPIGDPADNLRRAIETYEQALTVRTKATHPAEWAATQNNLGIALANIPTGDRADNLRRAIEAYEQALTVRTKATHPADWAMTLNNLGIAWAKMPIGDPADNLGRVIEACQQAMTVLTKAAHPIEWAGIHNNLGNAWSGLAALPGQNACNCLQRSIAASKGALTVCTPEAFPREHASTTKNLAIDRDAYESLGWAAAVPFDAIPPAE